MSGSPLETVSWDAAGHLHSPGAELAYLEAAFEDGTPALIAAAIGDIARGAGRVARRAGLSRETLYKSFTADGNPTLSTMLGVLKALDITLKPDALTRTAPGS